nr:hypothetical protein BaRGS_021194 [Batillaria attramentaria]
MVLILATLRLLAIFVFLQDRAAYLALTTEAYTSYSNYFMFFYNIFIGLSSCLLRIVKSIVIGTCLLSRLDYCVLPRQFEFLDPAFIIIVSVFIYGMVFFPLFACLAVGSVFGYGLGALYVWMMTAIEIFKLTECDTNTSTLELFGLVSVLDKILRHNKEVVESVEYVGTDDVQFELEWWRTIVHLQEILKFSVITGAVVSFAISVVNIVHSLTRFRPVALTLIIMLIVQRLLAMFIFLQDRASYLALDNRLDYCLLPRNFEFLDQGFRAYVGYMHMEHAHTHPVVLVFTKLLLLRINSTCSSAQDDRFVHLAAFSQ